RPPPHSPPFPYPTLFRSQAATALILLLAANTSYADFPRLGSILARDRFLPHQFTFRGDRLAFSNGIIVLGVTASLLLIVFDADRSEETRLNSSHLGISYA